MTTTTTTQEGCAMIARNYRRYPEALERQLQLKFGRPRRRRPKQEKPQSFGGLALRQRYHPPRAMDAEQVPIGSTVRTPTGQLAKVEGYRGYKRDCRVRLVCRYLDPENKRFDVVLLAPELVTVLEVA
jgi:hypothetical protein